MTFPYAADNKAQRERLRALVARLSDADLARQVDHGWTVTAVLVHLAFWDSNRVDVLNRWVSKGEVPTPVGTPDSINEAVRVLSESIPPRAAAELAVKAADAIDHALEQLAPEMVTTIESAGWTRLLNRSLHRDEHLSQIEGTLGKKA